MKEVVRSPLEISSVRRDNLELHTDDQKAKAKGELLMLNQVSSSGANSTTSVNLHPRLESCQIINKTSSTTVLKRNDQEMKDAAAENSCSASSQCDAAVVTQPELSYNYPDLVGQRQPAPIQAEKNDATRPLCEESLKMSGIKVSADFPMIDDDDEGDESSVLDPEHIKEATVDMANSKPDLVEAVLVKTETVTVEPMPVPCYVNCPPPAPSTASTPPVLKSALKKSNGISSKKRGLRVSFHDTRVFYIDTEAEANAEPQLLTVHSLDLPLAPTDFRVFIPAYDFLPPAYVPASTTGFKAGVDRSYTYEDAIVSLQSYVQKVNNENEDDSEDEEFVAFNDAAKPAASTTTTELEPASSTSSVKESTEPQQSPPAEVVAQLNEAPNIDVNEENKTSNSVDAAEETVRCLTEANLREHEMILMEQDSLIDVIEQSRVSETDLEPEITSTNGKLVNTVVTNEKTLSPPLKELMVDVSVLAPSGVGAVGGHHPGADSARDNWQVELSPLNSIPGDSETESSTSSQDTIIMMTSEESERNENHIKQSQMTFNQMSKKDSPPHENANHTSANVSVCSQDSDETLKYDGNYQLNAIRNVDVEGNLIRSNYVPMTSSAAAASTSAQRTSSQIRQLMERNAVRRNLMRYSNTRLKKATPAAAGNSVVVNEVVNDIQPIERQRQWRSHESLLDTIKKLTLEENAGQKQQQQQFQINENENEEEDYVDHPTTTTVVNGFNAHLSNRDQVDERNFAMNGLINGNLSLQDIRALVNGGESSKTSADRNSSSSSATCEAVPGDLRQWKIRSNQWQQVHNNYAALGNHVNGGNYRSASMDALQHQQQPPVVAAVPLLKNGVARCATLKEQYNNKDFYRVSLSHNYSQSDDHLEAVDDDEDVVGEDDDNLDGELPDELSQFVQMDSGRIERLRKRYSYSDMDNYVNAFNRRSSVRGIKPRFGSTSEILKQMQNQLQPPPLANHRNSHMTWPYPNNHTNGFPNDSNYHDLGPRQALPVVQEEIYGSTKQQQQQPGRSSSSSSIYASLAEMRSAPISRVAPPPAAANNRSGRVLPNVHKQPPPYQPPPSPSQRNNLGGFNVTPTTTTSTTPLRIHTKDERGVPEGASSSPKVLSDSVRHYHSVNTGPAGHTTSDGVDDEAQEKQTQANNSGVVYYVMQV